VVARAPVSTFGGCGCADLAISFGRTRLSVHRPSGPVDKSAVSIR
jgi:hypothetical protein